MSIKIKNTIINSLNKIRDNQFDEDTIRTLLITSREYLKFDGLIRELAHFIAHPQRNQGLFHKKVNCRYAKLKLADQQMLKLNVSVNFSDIKTEDDLSDFLLGGINIEKIEARLFDTLYKDGLDDLPEDHLIQYTGFTKQLAEQFLKQSYTKTGQYYILNLLKTEKLLSLYEFLPKKENIDQKDIEETIQKGQALTAKTRKSIDRLCSVLRGAIYFNSVFTSESISNEFQTCFADVLKKFEIDLNYLTVIEVKLDDILLCLMALLHDSSFEFFDKNIARVYLCCNLKKESRDKSSTDLSHQDYLYQNGVLALYITYKFENKTTSYPLFVSDLEIKNYIDYEDFSSQDVSELQTELPWFNAIRPDKKLKLKAYA